MAWVLVRLKVRLLINGLRGSGLRAVGFVLGCLYAVGLGLVALGVLAALRTDRNSLGVVAEVGAVGLTLGWAAFPLLGFGSDETLDPTRLALLPIERRDLMAGLLGASMVGPVPAGTALALTGAVIAFAPASPGAVIVLAAGVCELAMCVALSRAVVTALSAALRSRKGRDLRIVLVAVIGFAPQLLRILLLGNVKVTDLGALRPAAHALSWFPPALPVRAMAAASGGHWAASIGELAGGLATVAALLAWWSRSLDSVMVTAESPPAATGSRARGGRERTGHVPLPLFSPWLTFLPRNRVGAVAARELRYTWREPRRRVQLVSGVLVPFVVLAGLISRSGLHEHRIVFTALLVAFLAGSNRAVNQFGSDGPAFWVHVAAGHDLRDDLRGKNLAVAVTSLPVAAVTALALAAVSGGWAELVMTVGLSVGLVGVLLGTGDVASVLLPIPAPEAAGNLWGSQGGQGCTTGLLSVAVLAVEAALGAPIVVGGLLARGVPARVAIVLAGTVYGFGIYRAGLAIAVRAGRDRGPELLDKIAVRQAA